MSRMRVCDDSKAMLACRTSGADAKLDPSRIQAELQRDAAGHYVAFRVWIGKQVQIHTDK